MNVSWLGAAAVIVTAELALRDVVSADVATVKLAAGYVVAVVGLTTFVTETVSVPLAPGQLPPAMVAVTVCPLTPVVALHFVLNPAANATAAPLTPNPAANVIETVGLLFPDGAGSGVVVVNWTVHGEVGPDVAPALVVPGAKLTELTCEANAELVPTQTPATSSAATLSSATGALRRAAR